MTVIFNLFKSCGWSTRSADNLKICDEKKTKADFSKPFRLVQVMAVEPLVHGRYIYIY